ncbi:MAG: hypothetical protein II304_03630 [Bacteroidales bacterium]|nr:hypothetical protein [Bacteroidales bacterium]
MKFDYGTMISPSPIKLSVGTLKKPTLQEISEISFDTFSFYQFLIKMTPKIYFTELLKDFDGEKQWNSLKQEEQDALTIFDIIINEKKIQSLYVDTLNFFFKETVIYQEDYFLLLDGNISNLKQISAEQIKGIITSETFNDIVIIIQQVCGIYNEEEDISNMKFKNDFGRQMYMRMLEAKKQAEEKSKKQTDKNKSLPNVISSVANRHPSLNFTNIWSLTIYQLLDTFHRLQANEMYEIDSTRVSVWGDEKKTFDCSLWYKNHYDDKST